MTNSSVNWRGRAQALIPSVKNLIDGKRVASGGSAPIRKHVPRDGSLFYEFGPGAKSDVADAVGSARRAFADGRWSKTSVQKRKDVLFRLATLIEANIEELALLDSMDVGKPISDALVFDIPTAAATIRFSAEAADKFYGKMYASDEGSLSYQLTRPVGVVGGIIGWNFPAVLAAGKIGPAVATGNSLILKPSELTPLSALRIAELALEAGVPEGVLNVVQGDAQVGAALALHNDVDLLTFTGSTQTGRRLLVASGESNSKRLILECGGKSANIVFPDCPNLDAVAESIVARAFWNQGEVCTASSRLIVHEDVKQDLLGRIIKQLASLHPADPLRPDTKFGAMVSAAHKDKVLQFIASGKRCGGQIIYSSASPPPFEGGFYLSPVVFDGAPDDAPIMQEEIFGPVLAVTGFHDENEAINKANGTIYGLSAIIWTKNLGVAHRVATGVNVGWTVVNATDRPDGGPGEGVVTVGGLKQSGMGVEGGLEGLEAYTTRTSVQYFV